MIYTVGRRESYDEVLLREGAVHKLGRRPGYPGGSVWPTPDSAFLHLVKRGLADYGVYIVNADWETDTAPSDLGSGPWRDLVRDAQIVGYWDPVTNGHYFFGTYHEAAFRLRMAVHQFLLEFLRSLGLLKLFSWLERKIPRL